MFFWTKLFKANTVSSVQKSKQAFLDVIFHQLIFLHVTVILIYHLTSHAILGSKYHQRYIKTQYNKTDIRSDFSYGRHCIVLKEKVFH